MLNITTVEPDYFKEFHCIGSECRNNCCSFPWNIEIDKKTYKKYKNVKNPKWLADKLKNNALKRNPLSTSKNDYGYIEQTSNSNNHFGKACVFQNQEGLCEIHQELGHEYLCNTCKQYPRVCNVYNVNTIENSCSLSCEAIVDILYHKKNMILFNNKIENLNQNKYIDRLSFIEKRLNPNNSPLYPHYFFIKSIGIAILQNRKYCFEDRLILLGLYCKKLDEIVKNDNLINLEHLSGKFVEALDSGIYDELLNANPNYQIQFLCSHFMLDNFVESRSFDNNIFSTIINNLHTEDKNKTEQELATLQATTYKQYLRNFNIFMKDKQHFLENIFVSEFHHLMMPLIFDTSFKSFMAFASYYIMLRFLVATYMGNGISISEETLIDIVSYYGKFTLHNNNRHQTVTDFLKINHMDDLAHMILLIKS